MCAIKYCLLLFNVINKSIFAFKTQGFDYLFWYNKNVGINERLTRKMFQAQTTYNLWDTSQKLCMFQEINLHISTAHSLYQYSNHIGFPWFDQSYTMQWPMESVVKPLHK